MLNEQQRGIILLVRSALTGHSERLPAGFDLAAVQKLIVEHQIAPLIYYGAVNCGIAAGCGAMSSLLTVTARLVSIGESQALEFGTIMQAFDSAGIDYMLLKGSELKRYYPKPEMRVMSDIDILIRPVQYEEIKKIMLRLGFREGVESDHELHWSKRDIRIELHKRLIPSYDKDYYAYFGDGWQRAKQTDEGACSYRLSDEDTLVYLVCHFAKHYRDGGIGIKHLTDLWLYRKRKPRLNEAYVREELKKLGLAVFYENVKMTCAVWFDGAAPTEMTDFLSGVIFDSGAYGRSKMQQVSWAVRISGEAASGKQARFRWKMEGIFPPYWKMCIKYPILKKLPVLLPLFWVVRWISVLLFRPNNVRKQIKRAEELSPEAIEHYRRSLEYVGLRYERGEKEK